MRCVARQWHAVTEVDVAVYPKQECVTPCTLVHDVWERQQVEGGMWAMQH